MSRALEAFPDSDPNRPFDEARCDRVHLIGPRGELVVRKATAARPRLLKKESFWDSAMASTTATRYIAYDYREKADRYEIDFPPGAITGAAGLLFDAALRRAVQASRFERAVAFVNR